MFQVGTVGFRSVKGKSKRSHDVSDFELTWGDLDTGNISPPTGFSPHEGFDAPG